MGLLFKSMAQVACGVAGTMLAGGVINSAVKFATRPAQKSGANASYTNG